MTADYRRLLQGDPCAYCGQRTPDQHIDHIEPRALGGTNSWDNCTAACMGCNLEKSSTPLLEVLCGERLAPPRYAARYDMNHAIAAVARAEHDLHRVSVHGLEDDLEEFLDDVRTARERLSGAEQCLARVRERLAA